MKKIFFTVILFALTHQFQAQVINIPDTNFKNALINTMCVDTNGDGFFNADADINNDNEIQVDEAEAILRLNVSSQNITELEGIENFTNLELLNCSVNQLTNLGFSQNLILKDLYCDDNQLATLDVSKNSRLEYLNCLVNNLTSLDVSQNNDLLFLYCGFNQLTALDISNNSSLMALFCYENLLTSLDLKNGNNALLLSMFTQGNSNLTCIEVDDSDISTNNSNWLKDASASYSTNCGYLGVDDFKNELQIICYPNPVSNILKIKTPLSDKINGIKVYDAFGKLIMKEEIHFEQLDLSNLNEGVFFLIIETDNSSFTRKIIKK